MIDSNISWLYFLVAHSSNFVFLGIILIILDHIRTIGKVVVLIFHEKYFQKIINKDNNVKRKKISILIAAYNEEQNIKEMVQSVLEAEYTNKEIIVIDDGSTDSTYEIVKKFADKGLIKLLHREKGGSKAEALNYGSAHATGEVITVIDADGALLGGTCFNQINLNLHNKNDMAICGNIVVSEGDNKVKNIWTKLQTIEFLISMELGKRFAAIFNNVLVIPGGFGIFQKNNFVAVGKYQSKLLGEDIDLTFKLHAMGIPIIFLPEARVELRVPNNRKALVRQRRRWAYGQMESLLNHKHILTSSKYRTGFRLAVFDMWTMDVFLNFLWIVTLFVILPVQLTWDYLPDLFNYFGIDLIEVVSQNIVPSVDLPEKSDNSDHHDIRKDYYLIVGMLILGYLITETVVFLYAIKLSGRKELLKILYLIPFMLGYRTFLRIIVLKGHIRALRHQPTSW